MCGRDVTEVRTRGWERERVRRRGGPVGKEKQGDMGGGENEKESGRWKGREAETD